MRKVVLVLLVAVMVGCGKGGPNISLVGPSDVDAAMLSSGNKNEESTRIATLYFSSPSSTMRVGEEFTVEIRVENASIFGGGYRVRFDTTHLQFVRIEEGDFLKKDGNQTWLASALKGEDLIVGQTRLGHVLNVSGSGTIAKITFKSIKSGTADIGFKDVSIKEQFVESGAYLLRSTHFEAQDITVNIE